MSSFSSYGTCSRSSTTVCTPTFLNSLCSCFLGLTNPVGEPCVQSLFILMRICWIFLYSSACSGCRGGPTSKLMAEPFFSRTLILAGFTAVGGASSSSSLLFLLEAVCSSAAFDLYTHSSDFSTDCLSKSKSALICLYDSTSLSETSSCTCLKACKTSWRWLKCRNKRCRAPDTREG